ncbi:MAG TPA: MEDS domain-containing protein [Aggregatilineaceae bacterium]|nr:MEDS domain-containing protein [Aggregatilineaceae bacterium]
MCLIFDSDEQLQQIVTQFMAAGLRGGEIVRYAVDRTTPEQVRAWILETGVELPENAPLNISQAENTYCPQGRFDPHETISGMTPRYEKARQAGYPGMRSCGEMSWALRDIPGSDRFLEYEALINTVTSDFPFTGMCLYDARLFSGNTLFKVLQVHPYMIAQGQVVRNPFYLRPEEFLKGGPAQAEP